MQSRRSYDARVRSPGKALAILSCALTLLAAKPVVGVSAARAEPMALRAMAEEKPAAVTAYRAVERVAPRQTTTSTVRYAQAEPMGAAQTPRPFLAALGHFARMILADMSPLFPCPTVCTFEPVNFSPLVPEPSMASPAADSWNLPLPSERQFVLARCLLAPPC